MNGILFENMILFEYNFELLLNSKKKEIISFPDNIPSIYNQMKRNKNNLTEKDINFQIDYSDEEDFDVYDNITQIISL